MALRRSDMDVAGCGEPDCKHDHTILFMHARCHPRAGTVVSYDKRNGALKIVCKICEKRVAEIVVAP